ncbi:MAG: amidohydrolase [bacterium JZ-2024 1]
MSSLLVKNAWILTLDEHATAFPDGYIRCKDGVITEIGEGEPEKQEEEEVLDARKYFLLPGLINCHTHSAMVFLRGKADDLPLKEWLENHIWPMEREFVTPELIRHSVRLACLEMLKGGITTFCDMYFFQEEAAEVVKEVGMRALLGEGIIDFPTPSAKTPEEGLKKAERFIERWRSDERIRPIVAPHAPYSCSEKTLQLCRQLADTYQVPIQIHLAEEQWERLQFIQRYGYSSVVFLEKIGFLPGGRVNAAHSNWLDDEDIAILKNTHTGVSHNPESNMKLATGICRVSDLLRQEVAVGLGTDGAASNNDLNLWGEMRSATFLAKITQKDPSALPALVTLSLATRHAATALHQTDIGFLKKGMKADFILVNPSAPHFTPVWNPYSLLVYSGNASDVDTVVVGGKILMKNRQVLTVDEEKTRADFLAFLHSFLR